jgi:predicted GNAT family acetyltransferase
MLMRCVCLHDKKEIEPCLRKNVFLNIYGIGDLDDFFWPNTTWYGFQSGGHMAAIALIYTGHLIPALNAFSVEADPDMRKLLDAMRPILPNRFYAHLSPGLAEVLENTHNLEAKGALYKMALLDKDLAAAADASGVERLGPKDADSMQALYKQSYPGNWFDPRMLETNQYFGIKEKGRLISVAGVHVYSRKYRVAALGNITTLPEYRQKGCATRVAARLCCSLIDEGIDTGLNVAADNAAAIACYQRIGFKKIASYEEYLVTA